MLKVLASQAAISLENTRLYHDLENREARFRRLVDANIMGILSGVSKVRSLSPTMRFSAWRNTAVKMSPRAACAGRT